MDNLQNHRPMTGKSPILNSNDPDMELVVRATKGSRIIKMRCYGTNVALNIAYNYQRLGWDAEISTPWGATLYDSDFDIIFLGNDGLYKAVYIIGTR